MKPIITCVLAFSIFTTMPSLARQFESGINKVQLIELYTSEGCNSCPPADRWLSSLKDNSGLWSEFVPIAFHVDYWDYIGWKDPFAEHEYSQRQRRYAAEQNEAVVYTPGVRSNGQEWRGWRNGNHSKIAAATEVGNLVFNISSTGEFSAKFDKQADSPAPLLNVALLGLDLSSKVSRGENRGRELKHDFVALSLSRYSINPDSPNDSSSEWKGKLPATKTKSTRYAVAVWVSKGSDLNPIQSTGGYLSDAFRG